MTDTPAHTPLPWWVLSPGTGGIEILSSCDHAFHVAWIEGEWDEQKTNAAFIVRACNSHYQLVDALQGLVGLTDEGAKFSDRIAKARAALSQAGGE